MDDDQIDAYLELKWEEVYRFEHTPHPVEFRHVLQRQHIGTKTGVSSHALTERPHCVSVGPFFVKAASTHG